MHIMLIISLEKGCGYISLHIFKAVTTDCWAHSSVPLFFCNVGTLGWYVSVDRPRQSLRFDVFFCHRYGAAFIGMVVAAVYVFYMLDFTRDSDWFCSLYGGTWRVLFHVNMFWSNPSPVTCVQALYYFTHQNDGWYFKLSVRCCSIQTFCLSWFWITLRSLLL